MGLSGRGVFQCENTYLGTTSILQTGWTGNLAICQAAVSPVATFQSNLKGLQANGSSQCASTGCSYPRACYQVATSSPTRPTSSPTPVPTRVPSTLPTLTPTATPTTQSPTSQPTSSPTAVPSPAPTPSITEASTPVEIDPTPTPAPDDDGRGRPENTPTPQPNPTPAAMTQNVTYSIQLRSVHHLAGALVVINKQDLNLQGKA
jgi:hypothetical protein